MKKMIIAFGQKLFFVFLLLVLSVSQAAALNTAGLRAYPVPLNPKSNTMTIDDSGGTLGTLSTVKVYIYDINGDLVISRTYSSLPVIWNGRNNKGRYVKPGLYILKIEVENSSGGYGRRLIRILVNY